jgi:hypothetical protein
MRPVTRAVRGVSLLAVAAIALVGCAGGQPQPREYGEANTENEGYFGNFMLGCTGVQANEDGEYVDVRYESEEYCRCVFDRLRDPGDGVPFAEMQAFEEAQADAEEGTEITVPRNINRIMNSCADRSERN